MKEGLNFEEKKELPEKVDNSKKLKGIESFKLESEDLIMPRIEIPEPILKNNNKPKIVYAKKKDSIF